MSGTGVRRRNDVPGSRMGPSPGRAGNTFPPDMQTTRVAQAVRASRSAAGRRRSPQETRAFQPGSRRLRLGSEARGGPTNVASASGASRRRSLRTTAKRERANRALLTLTCYTHRFGQVALDSPAWEFACDWSGPPIARSAAPVRPDCDSRGWTGRTDRRSGVHQGAPSRRCLRRSRCAVAARS